MRIVEARNNTPALQVENLSFRTAKPLDLFRCADRENAMTGDGNCLRLRLLGILRPDLAMNRDQFDLRAQGEGRKKNDRQQKTLHH
jgi:hypothetical protein